MAWFIKNPALFEAEQFRGPKLPLPFSSKNACCFDGEQWYVVTAHGQQTKIVEGDWILPEPDGRGFYPCKPDIFEKICTPVETPPSQYQVDFHSGLLDRQQDNA